MRIKLLILYLFLSFSILSQEDIKFSSEILSNPIVNAEKLTSCFTYIELLKFEVDTSSSILFLENGYALFEFKNSNEWQKIKNKVVVSKISVIYTKYPWHNEDWITNYYDLLSNRINELFNIDSLLNSDKIDWFLVAQTACKTDSQAKEFIHGIEICFSIIEEDKSRLDNTEFDVLVPAKKEGSDEYRFYENDQSLKEHQKLMEKEAEMFPKKKKKMKKKKRKSKQDCPDFSKKKFRLFKRN